MPKAPRISIKERLARNTVAPKLIELLKPYDGEMMSRAIAEKIDLSEALSTDDGYLSTLKSLLIVVPFQGRLEKALKSKKWIDWFIDNEMKHKRPDLYNQILYAPKGRRYIRKQVRKIVEVVFT